MLYIFFSLPRSVTATIVSLALVIGLVAYAHESDEGHEHNEEVPVLAPELNIEEMMDLQLIVGEVTSVEADSAVVIEAEAAGSFRVSTSTLSELYVRRIGGAGRLLNPQPGDPIMLMTDGVTVTPAALGVREASADSPRTLVFFITTSSGREQLEIDSAAPIYRNAERSDLGAVRDGDTAVAIISADAKLLALDIEGSDDEVNPDVEPLESDDTADEDKSMPLWVWGLAAFVFVMLGLFFVRR